MKIAISSIIKNEQPYLEQWITYHLALGIDDIYLVEDTGSDSHSEITDKYEHVHLYQLSDLMEDADFKRKTIQADVANLFAAMLKNEFDWMTFMDIDEYIVCCEDLKDILNKYSDTDAIRMVWLTFNSNGHFYKPEGGDIKNYTVTQITPETNTLWLVKTFGNLKKNPFWTGPHTTRTGVICSEIQMNHYICRSFEDYCYKIYSRGDVYHRLHRQLKNYYAWNPDINQEEAEKYILEKYGTLDEYIDTLETKLTKDTKIIEGFNNYILKPELHEVKVSEWEQTITIPAYISKACGEIKYFDYTGLYSVTATQFGIQIKCKYFNGGSGITHRLKIYGEYGGTEYIDLVRFCSKY